ncbi:MAG TPA: hypothetical protein VFX50_00025, partial [Gemmatimonadales bacterium]|nr:hypothetical protein [Gemmatimonadales bacterium]
MYAFLRALRLGWAGAVAGGLAYELTGLVASLVKPGHDGKLFVSALAPLALLALLRAVRDRRPGGYALLALTVGLCMLSPHYQMTYYLLVAAGFWTLYLAFAGEPRPEGRGRFVALGASLGAVFLGLAISAIQAMPFLSYLPYAARGTNQGWEYATSFALPVEELMTTLLPQFNGVLQSYWGQNFFKLHTEYLGAIVLVLAAIGAGDPLRGRLRWILLFIGGFFLLVALGGHTPFYRAWYELMPLMKKVRAPGMAFMLPAFVVAVFTAFGVDRLLQRDLTLRQLLLPLGVVGAIALLGVLGALQGVAEAVARPEQMERVVANAGELRGGALRLLLVALVGATALWAVWAGRLRGPGAAALLALVVGGDLWSVARGFFEWSPRAAELYADDELITRLRATPLPYRVFDVPGGSGAYE